MNRGTKPSRPGGPPADLQTIDLLRQKITDLVLEHPQKAVTILTSWVNTGNQKQKQASIRKKTG